jgi:hypothetical protein
LFSCQFAKSRQAWSGINGPAQTASGLPGISFDPFQPLVKVQVIALTGAYGDAAVKPGLIKFICVIRPAEQTALSGDLVKGTFTVQVFGLVFRFLSPSGIR